MYPIHPILFRVMKWDSVTSYTLVTKYTFHCQGDKREVTECQWVPSPPRYFLCIHTHTHIHAHMFTHTHINQCPDIPGLWKDTCSSLNKILSDTTWTQATRVYSWNCWSAEITHSNPKLNISMSVWQMTNYRVPMISLFPKFFLCAYTHTHTSIQINPGFERTLAAPLIKSNPIPHEEEQLRFIVQTAGLLRLLIPIPKDMGLVLFRTYRFSSVLWQK